MIDSKLLDFKYYYDKLPMYLRNSSLFPEHFRIWCEFLNNIDNVSNDILGMVNIFDSAYMYKYTGICDNFLDMLGKLYGVSRNFSVVVYEGGVAQTKYLSLSQFDYLTLIKGQIIRNFFQGTNAELEQFYKEANLPILMKTSGSCQCDCYLFLGVVDGIDSSATNIINLFKSGMLTIESAGILYTYATYNSDTILKWDTSDRKWDRSNGGLWTI